MNAASMSQILIDNGSLSWAIPHNRRKTEVTR